MKLGFRKLITAFFLFFFCHSYSQELGKGFQLLSIKDGLSNNEVLCIFQDSIGFMWIGTHDGLNKFDGYKFTVYKRSTHGSGFLSDNIVRSINEDNEGVLWLGTNDGGLNRFDKKTGKFSNYIYNPSNPNASIMDFPINSIAIDRNDIVWFFAGDLGLVKFNAKTEKFFAYLNNPSDTESLLDNTVSAIYINTRGEIIAGTNKGLSIYNSKTDNFNNFILELPHISSISINAIYEPSNNSNEVYWLATSEGLVKFNRRDGTFNLFKLTEGDIYEYKSNQITNIIESRNKNLWVGTLDGIAIFNTQTNTFYPSSYVNSLSSLIINKRIITSYVDNAGIIWISIDKEGVLKYDAQINKFKLYKHEPFNIKSVPNGIIQGFYQNPDSTLWIGTSQRGLAYLDKDKNKITTYNYQKDNPNGISAENIHIIFTDSRSNLWIGTNNNGLNRIKITSGYRADRIEKFIHYGHDPSNPNSIVSNDLKIFLEDSKGRLWIGTLDGLDRFDYETEKFIHYPSEPNNPNSMVHKSVQNALKEDNDRNLWIGTWGGLEKMDVNDLNNIKHYHYKNDPKDSASISDNRVISNHIDEQGNIWLGTYGGGLNMLSNAEAQKENPKEAKFVRYSENEGLSNNLVYVILPDDDGNLWMSTNNGLSKFNIESKTFTNYYEINGLQSNEFFWGSGYKGFNGELFFGGTKGFNAFFPQDVKTNTYVPRIVITDFQIFNEPVAINENSVLKQSISETKKIVLNHTHKVISFEFASLHYSVSKYNKYVYKLEGFDDKWVKTTAGKRFAVYTNLDPGEYIFKVKGTNSEGVWNEEETSIKLIVLPPFWKTWWFITALVIAIISGALVFYRIKVNNIKKHNALLEKLVKDRTLELVETNSILEDKQQEVINQKFEVELQRDQIFQQKEEVETQKDKILEQNEELKLHRNHLEDLVLERTNELLLAKEEAEESDKLKTSFLTNISHEIRTPLNAIIGYSSLLEDPGFETESNQEFINYIRKNSDVLLNLVDNILDLAKIETTKLQIEYEIFNVPDFLSGIYNYWSLNNHIPQVKLRQIGKEKANELSLNSDKHKIRQILDNLVSNALKFTENGYIDIGYETNENSLTFYVKDTGIGISEENSRIIFKSFRKIEENKKKLYRGTGMGLAISRRLAEIIGGKLWVDSKLGKGSSFYLSLPYNTTNDEKKKPDEVKQTKLITNWKGRKVLIVEDDKASLLYLQQVLNRNNVESICAFNGKAAVELFQDGKRFDLVLMDIKMPILDGYEATRIIKEIDPNQLIIAQTAYAKRGNEKAMIEAGFDDFIAKPIKSRYLLSLLKKYFI